MTCLDDADLVCRGLQLWRLGAQLHLLFFSLRQYLLNISTFFAHIRIATLLHQIMLSHFPLSVFLVLSILTSNLRLGIGIDLREVLLDLFAFIALEVLGDVEDSGTGTDGGVVLLAGGVLVKAWRNVMAVWIIIQNTRIPLHIVPLPIRITILFTLN